MPIQKNTLLYITGAFVLLASLFFLSQTDIYIKQIGGVDSNGKVTNTISTAGDGKIYATPDMAEINLSFTEIDISSKNALDKVNAKVDQAIKLAKDNGLADTDIATTGLSVYTEYDYSGNSRRLLGQRATQSLSLKIRNIDRTASKAATLIDAVSGIENVQLNGISFDIEDKSRLYSQARELAYEKAQQKAKELSSLAGVKLLKPVSIADNTYEVSQKPFYANTNELRMAAGGGMDTQVPGGEIAVSTSLSILWGIE
jgi:uncharacterized protein